MLTLSSSRPRSQSNTQSLSQSIHERSRLLLPASRPPIGGPSAVVDGRARGWGSWSGDAVFAGEDADGQPHRRYYSVVVAVVVVVVVAVLAAVAVVELPAELPELSIRPIFTTKEMLSL